jgi:hypothetical protein
MKTNSIHAWPSALPESKISIFSSPTRRNRTGVVKKILPPDPPDEATIRRLNELARKNPFCTHHRVRKYDLL